MEQETVCKGTSGVYHRRFTGCIDVAIWAGDDVYTSIFNLNIEAISNFRDNFSQEDIAEVMLFKSKYIDFRTQANSNFLELKFMFTNLDEIYKFLFDFFKDTDKNEFDNFETKTINAASIQEVVKGLIANKGRNVNFSIPYPSQRTNLSDTHKQEKTTHIKNEIIMGDKIEVGAISNNSGQIVIGKDIRISDSLNGKKECSEKIEELIALIKDEANIDDEQRQALITNFDKVKEEVLEEKPDRSKIFKWLMNTKVVLENLVLSHHLTEAIHWVSNNLNFVIHYIKG